MNIEDIPNKQEGDELTAEEFNTVLTKVKELLSGLDMVNTEITTIKDDMMEPTISIQDPTTIALAGIPSNTNLYGKQAIEVLEQALYQELFPTSITGPSYVFSINPRGLQEVGDELTLIHSKDFRRGVISPQYQTDSGYRGGPVISYVDDIPDGGIVSVSPGRTYYYSTVNYSTGPQPKGSKGTNMPGYSPLPAGSLSSGDYVEGVYPHYATTSTISLLTKQALVAKGASIELPLVAESSSYKQSFRISKYWGNISIIEQLNTLSNLWESISIGNFSITTVQVEGVDYWEVTHTGDLIGSRRLKIKTT